MDNASFSFSLSTVLCSAGQTAELGVTPIGIDTTDVTYQWQILESVDEFGNEFFSDIDGANESTFITEPFVKSNGYRCVATDRFGNTAEAVFWVYCACGFQAVSEKSHVSIDIYTVNDGDDVTLRTAVYCDNPEEVAYQWYKCYTEEKVPGAFQKKDKLATRYATAKIAVK